MSKKASQELHPLFPSGDWEGFYTYSSGPDAEKHHMTMQLNFRAGIVTGTGQDDIAPFTWKGTYDTNNFVCQLIKSYQTHPVSYNGQVDENGIWGTWQLDFVSGGFHIWPKKGEAQNTATAKKKKSKKMVI